MAAGMAQARLVAAALLLSAACSQERGFNLPDDIITSDVPLSSPCSEVRACAPDLTCSPYGGSGLCTLPCSPDAPCPELTECHDEQCRWTTGTVGENCSADNPCHPGLTCLEMLDVNTCTRTCDWDLPCPDNQGALCIKLSDDQGQLCMRKCSDDTACPEGLACTPLTSAPAITVCFIDY